MTMIQTTKEHLKRSIEKKEYNLRKLLKEIQFYEAKIPLSKRKNIKGFKCVQRLKKDLLQPKTRGELEFKKNKNFRYNCYKYLLQNIKDLYLKKHKSKERVVEFLENENHRKDILKQLKTNYELCTDNSKYKNTQTVKNSNTLKLKPKGNVIYQKRNKPKLLPSDKNKFPLNNMDGSTSSTDSLEINYPLVKYNCLNKKSTHKQSNIELVAKPKETQIASVPNFKTWANLDKYRVKSNTIQPNVTNRNSSIPIIMPTNHKESNKTFQTMEVHTNSKSNLQHYCNLFNNIFYNQIHSSAENSLTHVQQRREHLTENIKNDVMQGQPKNTPYGKKVNNELKNFVQLVEN